MNEIASSSNVEKIEIKMAEPFIANIEDIIPYWRNPRKNAEAVEVVKKSIQEYGFNVPIMVDDKNVIITGHTRYKAMKELGATTILAVMNLDLDEKLSNEYRIADNAVGNIATWDMTLLPVDMRDMRIDIMQGFFPTMNLDSMMDEIKGSINHIVVTDETMLKTKQNLDSMFGNRAQESENDLVEITCPHCGDDFNISHSAFKSQLRVQADDKAADE